jgi:hypothetical protein
VVGRACSNFVSGRAGWAMGSRSQVQNILKIFELQGNIDYFHDDQTSFITPSKISDQSKNKTERILTVTLKSV